jgi:hypothetical protein
MGYSAAKTAATATEIIILEFQLHKFVQFAASHYRGTTAALVLTTPD